MTIKRGNSIPNLRRCGSGPSADNDKPVRVKKSVRFAKSKKGDIALQIKVIPSIADEDKKNVYFSNAEKQTMREHAFATARDLSYQGNRIMMMPTNRNSYTSLITRAFESCDRDCVGELSPEEKEQLTQQVSESHAHCRGLEKLTIQSIIKDNRLRLRRNSIRDLIENYSIEIANNGYLSSKVEESFIEDYRRSSLASRRFARLLAQLDQEAAESENRIESEDDSIESHNDEATLNYTVDQYDQGDLWRGSRELLVGC
mmetsp:Transcript_19378/g.29161  ORF Transcript_19378/g.29161 Transcript_19378/m.29161 type:complete len:258 (+) Transcript_19378:143-916(+)